jgi:hypothetical protein
MPKAAFDRLLLHTQQFRDAKTVVEKMRAVYNLRAVLTDTDTAALPLAIELVLYDLEQQLPVSDKESMRDMGYQFPEDFDKPRELLG